MAGAAVKKLTPVIPGGLFIGSLLNSALSFWPMVYYRPKYALDPARIGAYFSACQAFFYSWWILGWIPTGLLVADLFLAAPFGTGSIGTWNMYLAAYSGGEWLISTLVMSALYPALEAWFIKNRVIQAHEVLKKYDKDIVLGADTTIPKPKSE